MFLKVLFVEDSENDVALVLRELKRVGYEVASERVETAKAMQAALLDSPWDIILCDYNMPSFNALQALEVLKASGKDLPFIVVSGTIGEETAVLILKAGAQDFMLKDQMARLGPAIQRELQEAEIRHQHKQAEEKLSASEARLRALFAAMQDVVLIIDRNGIYREIGPTNPTIVYIPPQELLGKRLQDVFPAEQVEVFYKVIQEVLDTKQTLQIEYKLVIGDQSVWYEAAISPMDVDTTLWVAHDITKRKQAEEKLAASEAELRSLFASMTDVVMVLDADGRYVKIAPTNPINLYQSPDEMLGKTVHEILPKEQADYIVAKTREAIQTGRVIPAEYALQIGGKEVWFSCNATRLSENTALWVAHDITKRKQAEEVLVHQAQVMNQVHEAIIVCDLDRLITEWNVGAETMFGYSAEEMLGKPFSSIYPDDQRPSLIEEIQPQVRQKGWHEFETRLHSKSGQEFATHVLITALKDSKGRIVGFAGSAIDITESKQAEQVIHQHLAELETLYESGLVLGQLLSPKEIAQKLIDLMGAKLHWHHTTIRLYHAEDETLELLAFQLPTMISTAEYEAIKERFKSLITKADDGLSGWAVQHEQVVRVADLSHDPRYVEIASSMQSGLYVPLKVEEHVVGVISIESEKREAFSESDERLMITLANQGAVALENARLHEEAAHQIKQLEALHVIDQSIAGSVDQRSTLEILLTQTLDQLGADAAVIFLLGTYQYTLQYAVGKGFRTKIIENAGLKLGESLAGQAITERRMVHINDQEDRAPHSTLAKLWLEEEFKCMDAVSLISKGQVKGLLSVYHRKAFTPNPAWSSFLETLAGQAAIAIDNTQLFNGLQQANLELAVAYDATIEGWSRAMDLRDEETEGHTERVTEMSMQLGKAMELGEEYLVHLRRGALLHDIGKLGVPDNILLKADKLTDEEWQIMKQHPKLAYDMLYPIKYLYRVLDIPYCHHEKWDGTGYPRGLKGEQIPLAARIFATVDVWDALTSDRPYRKAWSKPDTLKYIREQSGKHFDPQVVDIFLKEFGHE